MWCISRRLISRKIYSRWSTYDTVRRYSSNHFKYKNSFRNVFSPLVLALPVPMLMGSMDQKEGEDELNHEPAPQMPNNQSLSIAKREIIIGIFALLFLIIFGEDKYASHWTEEDKKLLTKISKVSNILLLGKAGVGKSYLVNALIGKDLTNENDEDTGTFKAELFEFPVKIQNEQVGLLKIWDTVGLFSSVPRNKCIAELQRASSAGAIILAINGKEQRYYDDLTRLSEVLSELYGDISWIHRCVIVATRCNQYIKEKDENALKGRILDWKQNKIPQSLMDAGIPEENAFSVPVIWTSSKKNGEWKKYLIREIIQRVDKDNRDIFAMMDPNSVDKQTMKLISSESREVINKTNEKHGLLRKFVKSETVTKVYEYWQPIDPNDGNYTIDYID